MTRYMCAKIAAGWWAGWLDGTTKWEIGGEQNDQPMILANKQPQKKEEFSLALEEQIVYHISKYGVCRLFTDDKPREILAEVASKLGIVFNKHGPFPSYAKTKITNNKVIVSVNEDYKLLHNNQQKETKGKDGK